MHDVWGCGVVRMSCRIQVEVRVSSYLLPLCGFQGGDLHSKHLYLLSQPNSPISI